VRESEDITFPLASFALEAACNSTVDPTYESVYQVSITDGWPQTQ
jgi:hypothetical protein